MPEQPMDDNEEILNHVALECMHAMQNKDKTAFLDALKCLIMSIRDDDSEPTEPKEE